MMAVYRLDRYPLHLGLGATASVQPEFTGMEWYEAYVSRNSGDGAEGRLVTLSTFSENWPMWEMHPSGDEVVLCLSGAMTLHQEMRDGSTATVTIRAGEYAINPPGCWHTADIDGEAKALFITAGLGTEHRGRVR
jgi:quercetin dioxygenase-like cupin family protein